MIARRSLAEISGLVLSVLGTVVLARTLGPSTFGYYSAAAVITQLGTIVAGLGLAQAGSLLVAVDDIEIGRVVPLVCMPRLAVAALGLVPTLVLCLTGALGPDLSSILAVAALSWLFAGLRLEWLFVARGDIAFVSALRVVSGIAFLVGAILAALTRSPVAVGLTIVAPVAAPVLVALGRLSQPGNGSVGMWRTPQIAEIRTALASGLYFMRGEFGTFVTMSSDRLFLLAISGPTVLGLYDAAYRIILPFYSIAAVVNDSSYHALAGSREHDSLRSYSVRTLALTIPVGFLLALIASPIVDLLYGRAFAESATYLFFLGWVITAGFVSGVVVFPLTTWGRHREYAAAVTLGSVAALIGNAVLIPVFAGVGAALATIAGKAASAIAGYRSYTEVTSYPIRADIARTIAASTIAAAPAALVIWLTGGAAWIMAGVLFGFAYLGGCVVFFGYRGFWAALVGDGGRVKRSSMS